MSDHRTRMNQIYDAIYRNVEKMIEHRLDRRIGRVFEGGKVAGDNISGGGGSTPIPGDALPEGGYDDQYYPRDEADTTFAPTNHDHDAADITTGQFADARISESSVTQHAPSQTAFDDHSARHEQDGADALEASSLGTSETNDALVLKPDGTGGVVWGAGGNGNGGGGASALDDLSDVDTTGKEDGDVLTWNATGTSWGAGSSDVTAHAAETENVHGIDDTARIATAEYTIALIPDTQNLTGNDTNAAHFQALADFLTANANALGLDLILHLGDVVTSASTTTYDRADGPMTDLFESGVPTLACIGNHDYNPTGGASGDHEDHDDTGLWNTYFGVDRYDLQPWFGAVKDANRTENMYITPIVGGRPTLVLSLETFPRQATMEWADDVVAEHPHHDVIVITHSFMFIDGTRTEDNDAHGPNAYAVTDAISGEDMWQGWLKDWRNLKLVASGHHLAGNLSDRVDYGTNGNAVWQQFQNWQQVGQGGDGRVVLMTINPQTGAAFRRVFNPRVDAYDTTAGYERALILDQQQVDISALEAALNIEPGNGGSEPPAITAIYGTAAIEDPNTDVDVEHTAPQEPRRGEIQVTPASALFDASQFWLSNIGETTFRINLDTAPGSTNTVEFDWLYVQANEVDLHTVEVFTENGTWDWEAAGEPDTVDVLVVAGGGGGGSRYGGGGGGGLIWEEDFAVTGNVAVVVGAGGNGGTAEGNQGVDGENSEFGTLVAVGGGGGGGAKAGTATGSEVGRNGGSGGGGASQGGSLISGGDGTVDQGFDGGNSSPSGGSGNASGGGGGGAGEAGVSGNDSGKPGDGGDGLNFSTIFGTSVGDNGWFAGGGGGGGAQTPNFGAGGNGGGADGSPNHNPPPVAAMANTGGGGGGGGWTSNTEVADGSNGGSGIVIVRYIAS